MGDVVLYPVWRDECGRVKVIGASLTGMQMAGDDGALLPEFEGQMGHIDAPELLLAGSVRSSLVALENRGDVFSVTSRVWRAGCFE